MTKSLTLIYPAHGKNRGANRRADAKYPIPQLSLPTIAGLTDGRFDVRIIDENVEDIDFDVKTDLVGITTMTALAPRAYEISAKFRERNIPVILGGIHVSMMPEEGMANADSVLIGEAEGTWSTVLDDFLGSGMKRSYRSGDRHDLVGLPIPKLELLDKKKYFSTSLLMASRGCPHGCSYCSVTAFWGKSFRYRPVEEVIAELSSMKDPMVFFADDNLYGNKVYAKKLFKAMIPLKKKWSCQGDTLIAEDAELLRLAAESGCQWIFIGIESVSEKNLAKMRKSFNKVGKYKETFSKIHDAGINVFGSFIFGLDEDDERVFKDTVDFAIDAKIDAANFYILTPLPGTKLFDEYKSTGRLLHTEWDKYDANHVVFKHPHIDANGLTEGLISAYGHFYSPTSILRRIMRRSHKRLAQTLVLNIGRYLRRKRFSKICRM